MTTLETKIPPPALTLAFGLSMWLLSWVLPTVTINENLQWLIVTALIVIGLLFGASAALTFKRETTTINPLKPESASTLVCSGVFKYSRNPMYVGLALLLIAWAVYLSSPWLLLAVAGFILYMNRFQIMPEERALKTLFGSDYDEYCSRVRRWI